MSHWQDNLPAWAAAWAAVGDREATAEGGGIRAFGDGSEVEYVLGWPGAEADRAAGKAREDAAMVLSLVTDDPAGGLEYASGHQLETVKQSVLMTAATQDMDGAVPLPEGAGLSQAPLDRYDVVEIVQFGHPAASGRVCVEGDLAVIGALKTHQPDAGPDMGRAVLSALAEEAFIHGADVLYTVVPERKVPGYTATGWTSVARVISLRTARQG